MNVFISTVLFLTLGVSCISSVVLEGFFEIEDGGDDMISRLDTKAILNNLEHETFEEVSNVRRRTYNAKKCCKIGKKVAEESLFCNIDMMQVEKKNNGAHRRKMKFHGPLAQTENAQNDLMEKVEKCYPSKASRSMFTKCCQWQQSLIDELESCKDLESKEAKRDCRRDVKSRERRRKK
ncbi:uncharacterized protein LOC117122796 [Anneissia japonica]|uniref:uncharacterized protein LOC117122796 n=1 Tax=Anneissia japonica TaxID=1529436 RepID=UPI0014259679|nr:uncharacterized protein LOC117122796 [Anneissia japonica]